MYLGEKKDPSNTLQKQKIKNHMMVGLSEFYLNLTKSCTTVAHSQHRRNLRLFIKG